LSNELIEAFGRLSKLAPHIHLPVQSGSNAVLKRMNRRYTREQYLERVDALRQVCPDIAVSSDFIVGFPGERDRDLKASLDLIETVGFSSLFAFKYSDRPNAPATRFEPKVAENIKDERLQKLLAVQKDATETYLRRFVGTQTSVLVEGQNRHPDQLNTLQWHGRNPQNLIVHLDAEPGQGDLTGRVVSVKINTALKHCLKGTPAPKKEMSLVA
jgi:tRNA-2-methylthio-N6-dimethylallyladenosine synthase